MKALVRRLEALEGCRCGDLEAISDEELDARCVNLLERIEAAGVPMPPHWRQLDVITAMERVGPAIEAML